MTAKLSRRERALLYVLALFLLAAAAAYCLILPALSRYGELRTAVDTLRAAADQTRLALSQAEGAEADIAGLQADIDALQLRLLPYMAAEEADALLTRLLTQADMRPLSLDIRRHGPAAVAGDGADRAEDEALLDGGPNAERPSEAPGHQPVVCEIDAVFLGSLAAFVDLADALSRADGIRMTAASYSAAPAGESLTFYASFALYMAGP